MTNEEAIEYAREAHFCWGCISYQSNVCDTCEHRMFFEKAIEALEKQIPKKPTESYDGYADGYPVIDYRCPNCGHELDDTDYHCICGQTIDWSDEE